MQGEQNEEGSIICTRAGYAIRTSCMTGMSPSSSSAGTLNFTHQRMLQEELADIERIKRQNLR